MFSFLVGMKNEVLFSGLIRYIYFMTSQFLRGQKSHNFWFSLDHAGWLVYIFFCQVKESVNCNTSLIIIRPTESCRNQYSHNTAPCNPPHLAVTQSPSEAAVGKKAFNSHLSNSMTDADKDPNGYQVGYETLACQRLRCFPLDWKFLYLQLNWTSAE